MARTKTVKPRIRFVRVRDVKIPRRGNDLDAGIDFYTPVDLSPEDLTTANESAGQDAVGQNSQLEVTVVDKKIVVKTIILAPNSRVIIPSGIKVLIEPAASALIVHNKSGVSTKKGLIFTAQVVDSPYTGEIHLCVLNTSTVPVNIEMGEKLVQLIHVPIYPTEPEEITIKEYDSLAKDWGTRGEDWQGSTDKK